MNNQLMKPLSKNRDDYFRCSICGKLTLIETALRDPITEAYKCERGCEKYYEQPSYDSPLQSDV